MDVRNLWVSPVFCVLVGTKLFCHLRSHQFPKRPRREGFPQITWITLIVVFFILSSSFKEKTAGAVYTKIQRRALQKSLGCVQFRFAKNIVEINFLTGSACANLEVFKSYLKKTRVQNCAVVSFGF